MIKIITGWIVLVSLKMIRGTNKSNIKYYPEERGIPKKYLNSSARNIKNKKKSIFFSKYIKNFENLNISKNISAAIIIPDKDIIPGSENFSPAYIIFDNYEKILNWNRSLRFALAVCTLKENFVCMFLFC